MKIQGQSLPKGENDRLLFQEQICSVYDEDGLFYGKVPSGAELSAARALYDACVHRPAQFRSDPAVVARDVREPVLISGRIHAHKSRDAVYEGRHMCPLQGPLRGELGFAGAVYDPEGVAQQHVHVAGICELAVVDGKPLLGHKLLSGLPRYLLYEVHEELGDLAPLHGSLEVLLKFLEEIGG